MRIASYNVENLFDRPRIMNLDSWADGRKVLEDFAALSNLLEAPVYAPADKAEIVRLMIALGLEKADESRYVTLRRNRGALVRRPKAGGLEVSASGRGDWIGWLELRTEPVNAVAIDNTARAIRDIDADILAVVECEDRIALKAFTDDVAPRVGGRPYPNVMVIDGNDARGIDVGLMTKAGYRIRTMRSHIHDDDGAGPVFSRDCPEYEIVTPSGEIVWMLINHFKSKGFGGKAASDAKRRRQAAAVAEIYRRLCESGQSNVAVVGDLNDTPESGPLRPLFAETDLADVSALPGFDPGEFREAGTYGLGNDENKIDYVLLSPALQARVTKSGVFRKAAWPGSRPPRWTVYPELDRPERAGSDHHALWVDIA